MPHSKELKTWEGKPQWRWKKMYRGRLIYISCRELNLPRHLWTMKDSYPFALQFWRQRKADIDAEDRAALPAPKPLQQFVQTYAENPRIVTDPEEAFNYLFAKEQQALLDQQARLVASQFFQDNPELATSTPEDAIARAIEEKAKEIITRHVMGKIPLPADVAERLTPAEQDQFERLRATVHHQLAGPPERSIKALHDRWVKRQHDQAQAGKVTPGRADNNRIALGHFRDFLSETADVEKCIDADHLDTFYLFCRRKM